MGTHDHEEEERCWMPGCAARATTFAFIGGAPVCEQHRDGHPDRAAAEDASPAGAPTRPALMHLASPILMAPRQGFEVAAVVQVGQQTDPEDAERTNAIQKHRETFRRHGFDDYAIDFSYVKPVAIEAMATALVALEARSGASPASTESAALNAALGGRHVCLNCGTRWKIEDGKEVRCPSCMRVTGIEILSEDYVDVRGKRHDRRCDVAVYDDAHKPCSLGCGAKDPGAAGRCAYALATSTDAPFPGYCGDVADPEATRCADHRRIEAEAIARDERQRIASFLRLEADALERMGHQGAVVLRTEADAVERQPVGYVADALGPAVSGDKARRRTVNAKDVMLRLPHDETAPEKLYSFPNPDALIVAFRALNQEVYLFADDEQRSRDRVTVSYDHVAYVLMLAHAYLDLTMYELGQECCVEKLRDIWRARRAAAKG